MTGRSSRVARKLAWLCTLVGALAGLANAQRPGSHWVGTWATSCVYRLQTPPPAPPSGQAPQFQAPPNFANSTFREIVHTSIGGVEARVVVTNAFGTAPLSISAAGIELRDKDSSIQAGSSHPVLFGGKASVTIPAGAEMISDPVKMTIPAMADVAIDLFFPNEMLASTSPMTYHSGANQTNYISKPGNFVGSAEFQPAGTANSWYFLARMDVRSSNTALVAFGDSITDGTRSTLNTNNRWPDLLGKRLAASKANVARGILNEAIAGNRLLSEQLPQFGINALARFARDVMDLDGATHIVVLEGINDIGMGRAGTAPSAEELIAAHQQIIERAHGKGLKAIGATLTPFEGAAYFTAEGEVKRKAINAWIRAAGTAGATVHYDSFIDFDKATQDPANPTKFNPAYDSGDHLHPNDAGYKAMAESIDLKLFEPGVARATAAKK